ncbi:calumenin-B-like isoform X1 [Dreissena polymorpha]|uniref:calumenin-B-like isoform X1 n=1 Tax=Dreissena polymorpha TaxID=45954 RepID=UPI0022649AAB|nr:calumenin-B-like isoform X1 [Dreissena polymorpha]
MKLGSAGVALALLTSSCCIALPPNKEHKERVVDVKLSNKEHDLNGEHNADYDHDAFMGKEAGEFEDLTPEESRKRLGMIVDKIDKDHDLFVTEQELQQWIQYVQKKYVLEDTDRMWKDHELDGGALSWDSYRKRTYGYEYDPDEEQDFAEMVKRDERKFKQADQDGDGKLTKEEFAAFLHPEEHDHMKDIVVLETMEDIDKDKDGKISLEEYIADIYDPEEDDDDEHDDNGGDENHDGVPDWVDSEREQFVLFRDKNRDGHLDPDEVGHWIIPESYENSITEAKHLTMVSDQDGDGKLTKQEILDKYDVFVGSQATDFGDALNRHDEF